MNDHELVWCVVGNIVEQRLAGEGGVDVKRGTKHFPPGAKVYCAPPLWGDGYESIKVVGRHRGSHRYVTMVIESAWVTNWRVKAVYSPYVVRALRDSWRDIGIDASPTWTKERAERMVESLVSRSK